MLIDEADVYMEKRTGGRDKIHQNSLCSGTCAHYLIITLPAFLWLKFPGSLFTDHGILYRHAVPGELTVRELRAALTETVCKDYESSRSI
jgi:hypothetical protein